jgi:hypothetical protein
MTRENQAGAGPAPPGPQPAGTNETNAAVDADGAETASPGVAGRAGPEAVRRDDDDSKTQAGE